MNRDRTVAPLILAGQIHSVRSESLFFMASKLIISRSAGKNSQPNSEKRYLEIAATVRDSEMPRYSTSEGESTEVHVRTEGPVQGPKKARSPSDTRNRPTSAVPTRKGSPDSDLEAQEKGPGSGAFVSKVVAMFRSNDRAALPSPSMIVNVKTQTEEHTDPSEQYDPEQPRWTTPRGGQTHADTGI